MAHSLAGNPAAAIDALLVSGGQFLNTKLIDLSQQMLLRYTDRLPQAASLQESVDQLRSQCGTAPARAILGQENERQPGAVALRTRSAALRATTTANQAPTDRP